MLGSTRRLFSPKIRTHARRVDGVRLHWAELGPEDGRPVVLLHGISDSHRTWLRMAPHLARGRRILMPDLAGHGLSARPNASYRLEWHADIVGHWLGGLGLGEVDLVGHSYGGGVAQWMLLSHRRKVRRVALVAAGGLGREVGLPLRLSTLPVVVERFGQAFMGPGTAIALRIMTGLRAALDPRDLLHRSRMNAIPGTARAFVRTMRDVVDLGGQVRHFLDRAHEIEDLPPIALFWGEADGVIPVAHGQATSRLLHGAPLTVFPRCGHFPHVERPAELAHALAEFFDGPAASPRLAAEAAQQERPRARAS